MYFVNLPKLHLLGLALNNNPTNSLLKYFMISFMRLKSRTCHFTNLYTMRKLCHANSGVGANWLVFVFHHYANVDVSVPVSENDLFKVYWWPTFIQLDFSTPWFCIRTNFDRTLSSLYTALVWNSLHQLWFSYLHEFSECFFL